jgi:hypothetical protein
LQRKYRGWCVGNIFEELYLYQWRNTMDIETCIAKQGLGYLLGRVVMLLFEGGKPPSLGALKAARALLDKEIELREVRPRVDFGRVTHPIAPVDPLEKIDLPRGPYDAPAPWEKTAKPGDRRDSYSLWGEAADANAKREGA